MRVAPPHIRKTRTTADVMGDVCIALIPTILAAVWFFRIDALLRLTVAAVCSLVAGRLTGKRDGPDLAALVSGLILCLSCPSQTPLWLLVGGCFFAVCVVRDGFGGIGQNLFNPAMAARGLMLAIFPSQLTGFGLPGALSSATPLVGDASLFDLVVGRIGGSMGETSALMIAIGLAWLLIRRVIRWHIPLLSLAGFSLLTLLAGEPLLPALFSGGLLFGAVFVFTDYTTKPITLAGEIAFALAVGVLTAVLRFYGPYPEGVCFAVLTMNLVAPLFEFLTIPKGVSQ